MVLADSLDCTWLDDRFVSVRLSVRVPKISRESRQCRRLALAERGDRQNSCFAPG
jgi:hypothetical protein